ncbi:hypothetical protein GCM10027046_11860 [Uliginosibacterium flavum]
MLRSGWPALIGVLVVSSVVMLGIGYGVFEYYVNHARGFGGYAALQDPATLGTLGDFFGGILNPVFGFLSVGGLLVAVMLQREQLAQVKRDTQESAKAAEKKAFEDTFFQTIRLHQEVLNSIELNDEKGFVKGRAAIHRMYVESFSDYDFLDMCQNWSDKEEFLFWLSDYYDDNYAQFGHLVEHYYQSIENIARFLHSSTIKNKTFYARLLRGQFSQSELLMIFFHALREDAFFFKEFIENLALFEGLRSENLPDYSLLSLYEAEAYGMGLTRWSCLRNGMVSDSMSPVSQKRAMKAVFEMIASSQARLKSVKARKAEALSAGGDAENEAEEAAKRELEVSRLNRLYKTLSTDRGGD